MTAWKKKSTIRTAIQRYIENSTQDFTTEEVVSSLRSEGIETSSNFCTSVIRSTPGIRRTNEGRRPATWGKVE